MSGIAPDKPIKGRLKMNANLVIGNIVSGYYWTWKDGCMSNKKSFEHGKIIGFNRYGRPIIEVKVGNWTFKVSHTDIRTIDEEGR